MFYSKAQHVAQQGQKEKKNTMCPMEGSPKMMLPFLAPVFLEVLDPGINMGLKLQWFRVIFLGGGVWCGWGGDLCVAGDFFFLMACLGSCSQAWNVIDSSGGDKSAGKAQVRPSQVLNKCILAHGYLHHPRTVYFFRLLDFDAVMIGGVRAVLSDSKYQHTLIATSAKGPQASSIRMAR